MNFDRYLHSSFPYERIQWFWNEARDGETFQSMQNSSRDKNFSNKYKISISVRRNLNCSNSKLRNFACNTSLPLLLSATESIMSKHCFPAVYEIGEPWPLVITSRHHSGKEYFRASISKFAATNIQNLGPIISRPFEVSEHRVGTARARIVLSSPPLLWAKVRGTNAPAFRETWLPLRETVIDTFEMQLECWNSLGEFGIPRFPMMWRRGYAWIFDSKLLQSTSPFALI